VIKNVQSLRATAAFLVVFVHLSGLLKTLNLPAFGTGGVDLFFVISGFVMVHATRAHKPTWNSFIKNRIARIVPIYWVATIAVFVAANIAHSLVREIGEYNFVNLLKSLFFVPYAKTTGLVRPILFVGWTLDYEMFFYLLFAFGLALKNYILGLLCVVVILVLLVASGLVFQPSSVIPTFYCNPMMLEFALGMGVGLWVERAPDAASPIARCCLLLSLLGLPLIVIGPVVWPHTPSLFTAGIPAAILVTGAVLLERWGWFVQTRWIMAVGDASYIFYLSHPYFTEAAERICKSYKPTGLVSLIIIALTLAIVVLTALLLHRTVERPLSRLARGILLTERLEVRAA